MYRNILLALVSAIALTGSAAFAADLPSRAPPPVYLPPPPVFTWTGIYIGGQVGYAWSSGNFKFFGVDPISGIAFSASGDPNPNGVIGGGHVGYQYQINQWVLGIEGSVDGTSLSKTAVVALPGVFGGGATVNAHSSADIQGSIRGKLGIAWDRVLIYATGGVAFGGFNTDWSLAGTTPAGVPIFASSNFSNTRVGWTVGGGLQYAVTNNWWIFAEYRYSDFGSVNNGLFGTALPVGTIFNGNRQITQNQVQAGFSYKFDM